MHAFYEPSIQSLSLPSLNKRKRNKRKEKQVKEKQVKEKQVKEKQVKEKQVKRREENGNPNCYSKLPPSDFGQSVNNRFLQDSFTGSKKKFDAIPSTENAPGI